MKTHEELCKSGEIHGSQYNRRRKSVVETQKEIAVQALEEITKLHLGGIEFAQAAGWAAIKSANAALERIKKAGEHFPSDPINQRETYTLMNGDDKS